MEFGETVSYYLVKLDMSAREVANRAGLTEAYMSKLRNGQCKDPTFKKALAIIGALGVTVEEFISMEKSDEHPEAQDR